MFVQAIYGQSLKAVSNIRCVKDLFWFGHKYDIGEVESAVCEVITSQEFLAVPLSQDLQDLVDFYKAVHDKSDAVQNVIFQIMQRITSDEGSDCWSGLVLALRHVNEALTQYREDPVWMLDILRDAVFCMRSEEDVKGFKLLMPSPCCGSGGFNLQEWQAFVEELQPGDFQQSVVHWCVHMERDYYKQYIQALHPDNQVDIYEGRVVLE